LVSQKPSDRLSTINPWASQTLNFIYGCKKVSEGCEKCYIDRRPWNLQLEKYGMKTPFQGSVHYFDERNQIRKMESFPDNSVIWTNGLGDTFSSFIPNSKRDRWHDIFESRPQFQFVICTKRPEKMLQYYRRRRVPDNVWVGTTVETRRYVPRIDLLRKVDAKIRWVSFEPLLEDLADIDLKGIQWAAVGGETEPAGKFRNFSEQWALNLAKICKRDSVSFWYEGANGFSDGKRMGNGLLNGKLCQDYPPFASSRQLILR
jgi:protein gp37